MAKKNNLSTLLLLGAVGIGGYLLYKTFFGTKTAAQTPNYNTNWIPGDYTPQTPINQDENTPTITPNIPIPTVPNLPTVPNIPTVPQTPPTAPKTPNPIINPSIIITPNQDIIVKPIPAPIPKQEIMYEITKAPGVINTITIPTPLGVTSATLSQNTAQAWTGATYMQTAQPSVTFLENTLRAATSPTAPTTTKMAATAIAAGAPPRVVAKIKSGTWY